MSNTNNEVTRIVRIEPSDLDYSTDAMYPRREIVAPKRCGNCGSVGHKGHCVECDGERRRYANVMRGIPVTGRGLVGMPVSK